MMKINWCIFGLKNNINANSQKFNTIINSGQNIFKGSDEELFLVPFSIDFLEDNILDNLKSIFLDINLDPESVKFHSRGNVNSFKETNNYLNYLINVSRNNMVNNKGYLGHFFIFVLIEGNYIPVGYCSLFQNENKAEILISYSILKDFEGKGYGTRALKTLLDFIKHAKIQYNLEDLEVVIAVIASKNFGSIRLAQKNNFKLISEHNAISSAFDVLIYQYRL